MKNIFESSCCNQSGTKSIGCQLVSGSLIGALGSKNGVLLTDLCVDSWLAV